MNKDNNRKIKQIPIPVYVPIIIVVIHRYSYAGLHAANPPYNFPARYGIGMSLRVSTLHYYWL
ncbi:hypothetical protein THIOM_004891 [Candidatus Thiomargarita nelsonii]|uniref:Uncharacterized protein n=1 Tax=Candidatus Thiomargarita nelsonii TaxID=1003181 RepID=A0A176RUQ3_9GAMM|nr:hypothetical protein THIOM_004891 [Candidatus Thiomargarita nelsonii]